MSKWVKYWNTIKKDWKGFSVLTKIWVLIELLTTAFIFIILLDGIGIL